MAYNKDKLIKEALKAIDKEGLVFFSDVVCFLPITESGAYKKKLHEVEAIKQALYKNKQNKKRGLRTKWEDSENATLQMGLYKLLANEDELERLNNNRQKIETDNKHQVEGSIELVFEGLHDLPSNESDIEEDIDGFGFVKK